MWSAALLFLIRTSNIIFNNFGETVFLKRFGVEYLPTVYMINAIVTFFIMGAITGFMRKMPSPPAFWPSCWLRLRGLPGPFAHRGGP